MTSPDHVPDESSPLLQEEDVRALVSLLADVAALKANHAEKKCYLLDGLCKMVGATKWLWALRVTGPGDDGPAFVSCLQGGFSPEQMASIAASASAPSTREIDAAYARELERRGEQITLRLQDLDVNNLWPNSPTQKHAHEAGVGDMVSSTKPIDATKASTVALYRPPGAEPFSPRDRRMVHVVLTEVDWLHTVDWPEESHVQAVPAMPPQHLVLLTLLIQGHSRDEIAQLMFLSVHTVNSYAKAVYKHFDVNSQTELMRRFIFGDGNDQLAPPEPD